MSISSYKLILQPCPVRLISRTIPFSLRFNILNLRLILPSRHFRCHFGSALCPSFCVPTQLRNFPVLVSLHLLDHRFGTQQFTSHFLLR
jgi:hypothetical protein